MSSRQTKAFLFVVRKRLLSSARQHLLRRSTMPIQLWFASYFLPKGDARLCKANDGLSWRELRNLLLRTCAIDSIAMTKTGLDV